ncbi:protein FAM187B isoform X3 [Erinaceus europaeus]|uniref:Protein FAM187B isoform X3 n=1 Tax=Erinaceus europaeus TaxID=9365 RepID=A0ABM3WYS1_ERIEU|nr:protein FAM187B isoform X3 [Erinaceus europaeus]
MPPPPPPPPPLLQAPPPPRARRPPARRCRRLRAPGRTQPPPARCTRPSASSPGRRRRRDLGLRRPSQMAAASPWVSGTHARRPAWPRPVADLCCSRRGFLFSPLFFFLLYLSCARAATAARARGGRARGEGSPRGARAPSRRAGGRTRARVSAGRWGSAPASGPPGWNAGLDGTPGGPEEGLPSSGRGRSRASEAGKPIIWEADGVPLTWQGQLSGQDLSTMLDPSNGGRRLQVFQPAIYKCFVQQELVARFNPKADMEKLESPWKVGARPRLQPHKGKADLVLQGLKLMLLVGLALGLLGGLFKFLCPARGKWGDQVLLVK